MLRPALSLLLLLACGGVSGCGARAQTAAGPRPVAVVAQPLQLDPEDRSRRTVGELTWAGGLHLMAPGEPAFGGVSGIDVDADGRFLAQTDTGRLLRGALRLDPAGRLAGLDGVTIQTLTDEQGAPYRRKVEVDAEDVTLTPDGYAVSFEQYHRVLRYRGLDGGPGEPQAIPSAMAQRPRNAGLEALAWKDGRFYEGAEDGEIWRCEPGRRGRCVSVMPRSPYPGYKLTGLDAAGRGFVAVYRDVDVFAGWRAAIAWLEPARTDGSGPWKARRLAVLGRPLTRDNMEGIAAVPRPGGGFRLYLVSDDGFYAFERTLLLAFDWPGPPARR